MGNPWEATWGKETRAMYPFFDLALAHAIMQERLRQAELDAVDRWARSQQRSRQAGFARQRRDGRLARAARALRAALARRPVL
ncbi:MAG: hypothetical protein IMX02_08440 [Limnochordaceae bacterium]|nr:hypothetical protein [Limnochordaceae bacterium]